MTIDVIPNPEAVLFAADIARCIDRIEIAGRATFEVTARRIADRDELAPVVALVVGFLPADGMTWGELGTILRYVPNGMVREQAAQLAAVGVVEVTDDGVAYTDAGRRSAQHLLDAHPSALDELWSIDRDRLPTVVEVLRPVVSAALGTGSDSPTIVARALVPSQDDVAFDVWRSVSIIRRHRADAHAGAWASAGHTPASIQTLRDHAKRAAIEATTNLRNATVWTSVDHDERQTLLALLGGLNGAGDPS